MKVFPFSQVEWQNVQDTALAIVNATLADDSVLRSSHYETLLIQLDELCHLYGEHPILIETAADFSDIPLQRVKMYRSAIKLANKYNLPTLTIRLSLASVLLQELQDPTQAAQELIACKPELDEEADEAQIQTWNELTNQCRCVGVNRPFATYGKENGFPQNSE